MPGTGSRSIPLAWVLERCGRPSRRAAAVSLLALLFSLSAAEARRVILIDHDPNAEDGYLTGKEGYYRDRPQKDDLIILGGSLKDGLAQVKNGDTLIIVAHGGSIGGGADHQFKWGGKTYSEFGVGGPGEIEVPSTLNELKNVSVTLDMCWSAAPNARPCDPSIISKLLEAMGGGTNKATGYLGISNAVIDVLVPIPKGLSEAQVQTYLNEVTRIVTTDRTFTNYPPANRSDPPPVPNHNTEALKLLKKKWNLAGFDPPTAAEVTYSRDNKDKRLTLGGKALDGAVEGEVSCSPVQIRVNTLFADGFESGDTASWSAPGPVYEESLLVLPGGEYLEFVHVPAGTFTMGTTFEERSSLSNEWPEHQVTLTQGYMVGKTEVTQAQWEAVMGPWLPAVDHGIGPCYPMYGISWNEIAGPGGFIENLNDYLEETGQAGATPIRLPTEAEWERAARAGTQTRFSHGDALECPFDSCFETCASHDPFMVYCAPSSAEVGSLQPNGFGLFDMHGNVEEFVQDNYADKYPGTDPRIDPLVVSATSPYYVKRGGYWGEGPERLRSAARGVYHADGHHYDVGFRLARSE